MYICIYVYMYIYGTPGQNGKPYLLSHYVVAQKAIWY